MIPVKLYTAYGEFVAEVLVPSFQKPAECIGWGLRTFYYRPEIDEYREGLMYIAMTQEEHKKLAAGGTVLFGEPETGHTAGSLIGKLSMLGQLYGFEHRVLVQGEPDPAPVDVEFQPAKRACAEADDPQRRTTGADSPAQFLLFPRKR